MPENLRTLGSLRSREERTSEAVRIGADGIYLLDAIWSELAPSWLRQVEAVEILRLVWIQQFYVENNVVKLRETDDSPPSSILINSPYDLDARSRINLISKNSPTKSYHTPDPPLFFTSLNNWSNASINECTPSTSNWSVICRNGISVRSISSIILLAISKSSMRLIQGCP